MIPTRINDRWDLQLPDHRALRPGWRWWERQRLASLHAVIRPGDALYEIGAEEGDLAALYASWGAEIVAVEPDSGAWPYIRATFEANGLPTPFCYEGFVGSDSGAPALPPAWPPCAWEETRPDRTDLQLSDGSEIARCTLDDLARAAGLPPDIISVDVDGAELLVLLGAEEILAARHAIWYIAVHPEHMRRLYGHTPDDVICHMELHGYDAEWLGYDHEHHWLFKPLHRRQA